MTRRSRAWDRLQADWGVLHDGPDEHLPSRTAPYDELLARSGSLSPPTDAYPAARLAREHARRVEYWTTRLEASAPASSDRPQGRRGRETERIMLVGGSLGAIGLIALAWRTSWPIALAAALGLAGTVALLALALRASERPRLGDALRRGLCPDCGYDLSSLPPALPPEPLGGVRVGPSACPECGCPWPAVPPPTPEHAAEMPARPDTTSAPAANDARHAR